MAPSLILLSFLVFSSFPPLGAAQNCYYPDGSISTEGVAECSRHGGVCCPLNWQCMSNGLCYLENEGYYGRYSCTDRTWQSPDCPNFCTQDLTAIGNEAILWCPNGDWCCDGDRVSGNCCNQADAVRFNLPDPTPIAFISDVPSPTPVSSYAGNVGNPPSPSSSESLGTLSFIPYPTQESSILESTTASTNKAISTITHESVTTGTNGAISTVTQIVTAGSSKGKPSSMEDPSKKHGSSHKAMVIGLAVGIPIFLIVAGILLFFSARHIRQSNKLHQRPNPPPQLTEVKYTDIPPGTHAYEADGAPVAFGRTKSGRTSELYGSDVNLRSPNPSIATTVSGPPQYSPVGKKETPGMSSINEEPVELWGTPGYRPYRPPPEHP